MDLVREVMEVKAGEELMSFSLSEIWASCLLVWVVVGRRAAMVWVVVFSLGAAGELSWLFGKVFVPGRVPVFEVVVSGMVWKNLSLVCLGKGRAGNMGRAVGHIPGKSLVGIPARMSGIGSVWLQPLLFQPGKCREIFGLWDAQCKR